MTSVSPSTRTNTLYLPPENAKFRLAPSNQAGKENTSGPADKSDGVFVVSAVADVIVPGYSSDSLTPVPGGATDIIPPSATPSQIITAGKHTIDVSRLNSNLTTEETEALEKWYKAPKANDEEIDGISGKAKVAISIDGTSDHIVYVTGKD